MARFWEGTLTYKENGTGETKVKNVKLVSTDSPGDPITNNTKFFDIKDAYNGFDECCTTAIRLVEITEETEEDTKRVDYNKRPEPLPQIEVTIYSYEPNQLFIKKATNGSVLTITPEDFQELQANPNDRYLFGACASAMAGIMENADYSPHEANFYDGSGVFPNTTVTIDFGPYWLEMVQDESTPAYMREICLFIFME